MWMLTQAALLILAVDNPGQVAQPVPRLMLVPNASTILQRDPLFLMCVVQNDTDTDLRLFHEPKQSGDYAILYLRKDDGEWRRIPTMQEIRNPRRDLEREERGRAVLGGSSFAEHQAIHRDATSPPAASRRGREQGQFLFEDAGTYELRAVVVSSWGQLTSASVFVKVAPRSAKEMDKIAAASKSLIFLEFHTMRWIPPDEIKDLASVGGNIGLAVENALLLQSFAKTGCIEGKLLPKDQICEYFEERLDPVSWEAWMGRLGDHFMLMADAQGIDEVAHSLPHDSFRRRALRMHLRYRANPLLFQLDPINEQKWHRSDFGGQGTEIVESE